MTPQLITDAVTKALEAAAVAGLTDTTKKAIGDSYTGLKSLICAKFGIQSEPAKAVEALEAKPGSKGRAEMLTEELSAAKVESDPDIVASAQALLELVRALPPSGNITQTAHGTGLAQAIHGNATVTMGAPPPTPGKDA